MRDSRRTQCDQLLSVFVASLGQWVPLPTILALGIAQFGARILELRRSGYTIRNKTEYRDGKVLSWYRLELEPTQEKEPEQSGDELPSSFPEFGPLAKESYGVD
jgi:hypothetical protein